MATVTGFTSERMLAIEKSTVISGSVNPAGSLLLSTRDGTQIDAGNVKGDTGAQGPQGFGIPGGTTDKRDSIFPLPVSNTDKVALANRGISWYNYDNGWFETYRANQGLVGLTVPGIAEPSGWYPVNVAPWYKVDQQMTLTRANFGWAALQSWDAGALGVDNSTGAAAQRSEPMPNFCEPGSASGTIRFKEVGLYDVYWYNAADSDPGKSGYRITTSGTWPGMHSSWEIFAQEQRASDSFYWETMIVAQGIRVPTVGLEIRLSGYQEKASINNPKVKVIKRGGGPTQ